MQGIRLYESTHTESNSNRIHYHHHYQLLYVMEGQGDIMLSGKLKPVAENCAVIIFPFTKHTISSKSRMESVVLTFDEAILNHLFDPLQKKDVFFTESFYIKLNSTYANEMKLVLRKLLIEEKQHTSYREWAMRTYMSELMLILCRARQSNNINDFNGLRAERLREYIDQHYSESFTAEQLANIFGVSVRFANTIFKEQYQTTPIQYLNEVRHGIAKKMLVETNKSIVSICFEAGYESLPTFYRSFKQFSNISPTQYRQLHRHDFLDKDDCRK